MCFAWTHTSFLLKVPPTYYVWIVKLLPLTENPSAGVSVCKTSSWHLICHTENVTTIWDNSYMDKYRENWKKILLSRNHSPQGKTTLNNKTLNIIKIIKSRSSRPKVFCKKMLLKVSQNSQKSSCARVSFARVSLRNIRF